MRDTLIRLTARAIELVTGPGAGPKERIWATQAITTLGDPVVMLPDDIPDEKLREHVLEVAWRLLGEPADRQRLQ